MKISLRFFAIVRERIGESERTIELPAGSTVADVMAWVDGEFSEIAPLFRASMVMLNQEYVGRGEALKDGDEIAFIPPVSGGSDDHVRVTDEPLNQVAIAAHAEHPGAGAIVTFAGVVRDNARGRGVLWLDYEAYPEAAEKMLTQICAEMRERWPVLAVAIEHRTGRLQIGEASVVIAVSSAHRAAGFEACAYCIERIKEIVPIWKKEAYADGEVWIGSEAAYQVETGRTPAPQ
ncbi:MAG: molybdopterin converting factor subunit 1 [Thermomicrobiales bacterium]|nr:molybdopterin converting factor subunit 1 [Thermomicrobiales bacterium]